MNLPLVRPLIVFSLLVTAIATAAPVSFTVEAETLAGAPRESAEGASGQAVVFDANVITIDYASPQPLPQGPSWILLRMKRTGAQSARIIVETGPGRSTTLEIPQERFASFRLSATSDGASPLSVHLTHVAGSVLLDRITFLQASDALPLPQGAAPAKPARIHLLYSPGPRRQQPAPLAETAATLQSRLQQQGIQTTGPADALGKIDAAAGDAIILVCNGWMDLGSLKWLPSMQRFNGPWIIKPAGVLGAQTVLGIRADAIDSLPMAEIRAIAETGEVPSISPPQAESAQTPGISPTDTAAIAKALISSDRDTALGGMTALNAWLDSADSLGSVSLDVLDNLEPALGNWLYRSRSWELTQEHLLLAGSLFSRLAFGANDLLNNDLQKKPPSMTPQALQRAMGLTVAAEAFSKYPFAAQWRKTADDVMAASASGGLYETFRGRLNAMTAIAAHQARTGRDNPQFVPMRTGLAALAWPEQGAFAFGDESAAGLQPLLDAANGLLEDVTPGGEAAVLIPLPQSRSPKSFDKLIQFNGFIALLDGISGGAGGYDDAGALLGLSHGGNDWVMGPGPGAADPKWQNGLSATVNGKPLTFAPMADLETQFPASMSIVSRSGASQSQWRRGLFFFPEQKAVVLLDELTPPAQARVEAANTLNLQGSASQPTPARVLVRQADQQLIIDSLGPGEVAVEKTGQGARWTQRWAGQSRPLCFRTTLSVAEEATPTSLGATGLRLGPRTAALMGPVAGPAMTLKAVAAKFSSDQIALAQMTQLEMENKTWLESSSPADILLRPDSIFVKTDAPITLRLQLPEGANFENMAAQRDGSFLQLSLPAGETTLKATEAAVMQPLFEAVPQALDSLAGAEAQTQSTASPALPGQFAQLRAITHDAALSHLVKITAEPADMRFIAASGKSLLSFDDRQRKPFASVSSTITALMMIDLDGDASPEIAAGCEDGSLHLFDQDGQSLGELSDESAPIIALRAVNADETDPQEIAILRQGGRVNILDSLGATRWSATSPEGSAWEWTDLENDGRMEAVLVMPKGGRQLLRFNPGGDVGAENLEPAAADITATLVVNEPQQQVLFGLSDGQVESFAIQQGKLLRSWSARVFKGPVSAIESSTAAEAPMIAASASGEVAALAFEQAPPVWVSNAEAPVKALYPVSDGTTVALTDSSLVLFSGEGNLSAMKPLDTSVSEGILAGTRPTLALATGNGLVFHVWSGTR